MSLLGREPARPILLGLGIMYLIGLGVALIWFQLSTLWIMALTLGGCGLMLLILNPVVGVHAFVILLFAENVVVSENGVTGMKVVGGVILAGWLLNVTIRRKPLFKLDGFVITMVFFLAWCGVTLIPAWDFGVALSRFLTFVQLGMATLMFASVLDTSAKARGLLRTIVVCTCIATIVGMILYYTGAATKVEGIGENRNRFACYINIAIVCSYILQQTAKTPLARIAAVSALPLLFMGLALTFSRAGILVMIVAVLALWFRFAKERKLRMVAASVIIVSAVAVALPETFWERVSTIVPAVRGRQETFGRRINLWQVGFRMIVDHPIMGVGIGNYERALPRYARGEMRSVQLRAHNAYVNVAAELGLVGLALFLLLHLQAIRSARAGIQRGERGDDPDLALVSIALETAILVVMLSALSASSEGLKYLWMLFGMSVAAGRMEPVGRSIQDTSQPT
jgi:O-antigen ligase